MKSAFKLFLVLFLFTSYTAVFAETTGEINFIEGTVDVSRKGEFLNYYEVDYGLEIFEDDIISTGPDGYLEIELSAPAAGTVIKVEPNTTFSFSEESNKTNTRLYGGSLALKVGKLTNREAMNVVTESAVMGVRGTEFNVIVSADTNVLITCKEGKVAAKAENTSSETYAEPGKVSKWSNKSGLVEDSVPVEKIDEYTKGWKKERIEALMINGLIASEGYRNQLSNFQPQMERAMNTLQSKKDILDFYAEKMEKGEELSRSDAVEDKIALSSGVMNVRSTLPMYEQTFFTLVQLYRHHEEGIGTGTFSDGTTSARFYKNFSRNLKDNMSMIASAHYYLKVYSYITHYASADNIMGGDNSLMDDFLNDSGF